MLSTLFNVVNNIEQVVEPESSPQSGVTMLNNILLTTLNNVGSTTLLHPVFSNLKRDFLPCSEEVENRDNDKRRKHTKYSIYLCEPENYCAPKKMHRGNLSDTKKLKNDFITKNLTQA